MLTALGPIYSEDFMLPRKRHRRDCEGDQDKDSGQWIPSGIPILSRKLDEVIESHRLLRLAHTPF
jgi:hypothetical protein